MSKLKLFSLLLTTLIFGLFSVKSAYADTVTLSGHISNNSNAAIIDATVDVINPNTNTTVASTTSDSSGDYTVIVTSGTYNVRVTPPAGSEFSSAIALNQNIASDKTLNFILTPAGTVTLSGRVLDSLNNPVAGQIVSLKIPSANFSTSSTTDVDGSYSLQVSSGTYVLDIFGTNNSLSVNVPRQYQLTDSNYVLNQSIVADIIIPAKRVDVHVQNQSGNSVEGVTIVPVGNTTGIQFSVGGTMLNGDGRSNYSQGGPQTDTSGNTTVWLLPNDNYTFTATPSSGPYQTVILSHIYVTTDRSLTITMPEIVTLSGRVLDSLNNPVAGQRVSLQIPSTNFSQSSTTDVDGNYSLTVSAGTYVLNVFGTNNDLSLNVPGQYELNASNYFLNQSTVADIVIPAKRVDVHVQSQSGASVEGATLVAVGNTASVGFSVGGNILNGSGRSNYSQGGPQTDASGNATVWLLPNDNYTFTATPPSGAYQTVVLSNIAVTTDRSLIITMPEIVTLSGRVLDSLNNPVASQAVSLKVLSANFSASSTTDVDGNYSLQVAAGTYMLDVFGTNNDLSLNIPRQYQLTASNYVLNQSTSADIIIPAKRVDVHVQNQSGNSVEGVTLVPVGNTTSVQFSVGGSILNGDGRSNYSQGGPQTDTSGNATVWLLSNDNYTFTATPPSGSPYSLFTLTNVGITQDQSQIVSLQYNHETPLTTIDLVTQHPDETYSDPTTATLSATADNGYTIANTYYKVDGGAQQTYTAPFTVSGEGNHTIEYWSVDNSGVQEAHKTKTFTIDVNQAPYVNPLSGGSINAGGTYTENGSFTDEDSTSWTATVDYGDGGGPQALTLNPDKTFSLSHQYTTAGTYTVTVVVRDDQQATGTTMATVTVNPAPPVTVTFNSAGDTYLKSGQGNHNQGAELFMTVQSSGHNRSLVRFNQTDLQSAIGNGTVLSAKVRLTITDNGNNWGTTGRTVDLHRLIKDWAEGNGTENDRGTGSGGTWNCATDSNIANQNDDCSGSTAWEMSNSSLWPFASSATATNTITNNQSGVVEFDVTSDVQSFMSGSNQNYGWLLKKTNEGQTGQVSFGTKESSSVPQLIIIYQP